MTMQMTTTDAWESARDARARAERDLRRSEMARARAAQALEANLRPMSIDEAERARLRTAYADAAAMAASMRHELERAAELETAVGVIIDAIDAAGQPRDELAGALLDLLASRQGARRRTSATRGRVSRGSSPLAGRAARLPGTPPQ